MAYKRTNWVNDETPVNSKNMNNIEDGIVQNETDINNLTKEVEGNSTSLNSHIDDKSNPHVVTKSQVGLGNVDNTSDKDKPVSTAQQTAINNAQVTAQKIFDLTENSDTIVREVDSNTSKVKIHLATAVNNKVNNALQMPTTQPTELLMVGINTSKAQTNIPLGTSLKLENGHLETAIKIVKKTQTEYDALTSYDPNTMYVIVG